MVVTTSTEVHILSPVYFMLFLVLVGLLYHLIRNKEYKDTLLASIIIGFIFGLIVNASYDLVKTLIGVLISIIFVLIGGFLSVALKKIVNNSTADPNDISTPEKPLKSKNWWNKQSPKFQAIIIMMICLFSVILITGVYSLSTHVEDPVQLNLHYDLSINGINLEDTLKEKNGNVIVLSNNTTKFSFNGSTEPNATVKITVNELGIYNQTVQLDSNSDFAYNLSLPQSVSQIEITVKATKPGKDNTIVTLYLKR